MNTDLINQYLSRMDEDQARAIMDALDEQQVAEAVEWAVEEKVVPHLDDIRERADQEASSDQVRAHFEEMTPREREDLFYDTLHALVGTLVACRVRPHEGFRELKTLLRDPYTLEALLMIFDGEDPETGERYIDPEYEQTLKDFGAEHVQWVAVMVLPEMYDEETERKVKQQFGLLDAGGTPDETAERG